MYEIKHSDGIEEATVIDTAATLFDAEDRAQAIMMEICDDMDESHFATRVNDNAWEIYDDAGLQHVILFEEIDRSAEKSD